MTCLVQMHETIEHLLDRFKKNPDAPAQKASDGISGRPASAAGSYGSMPGYGGAAAFSLQVRLLTLCLSGRGMRRDMGMFALHWLLDGALMPDCSTLGLCIAAQALFSNGMLDGCGAHDWDSLGQRRATHETLFPSLQGYEQPGLPSQYAYASQYGSTFVPAAGGAGAMQPLPGPGYYGTASCSVQTELPSVYWCCCTGCERWCCIPELCWAMATHITQQPV